MPMTTSTPLVAVSINGVLLPAHPGARNTTGGAPFGR